MKQLPTVTDEDRKAAASFVQSIKSVDPAKALLRTVEQLAAAMRHLETAQRRDTVSLANGTRVKVEQDGGTLRVSYAPNGAKRYRELIAIG